MQPEACPPHWPETWRGYADIDAMSGQPSRACGDKEIAACLQGLDGSFVATRPIRCARPVAVSMFFRPDEISTRSTIAPCRPPPLWSLGRALGRIHARAAFPGSRDLSRGPSVFRFGARPTCAPAATILPRRMALIGARPAGTRQLACRPASRSCPSPRSAARASMSRCGSPVSSAMRFPCRSNFSTRRCAPSARLDESRGRQPDRFAHAHGSRALLRPQGVSAGEAERLAGQRIFGSKPGTYGAGLQALIDEKLWTERCRSCPRLCSSGALMPMAPR